MKNSIPLFITFLFLHTSTFSQSPHCHNLFIWPFQTDSGKRPELAAQMTSDMEEMFLKNNCTVFTSADFPNVAERINVLPAAISLNEISMDILSLLTVMTADKLLMGRIRLDNGGNAIAQLTIYTLPGKELIGTKKLMFSELELQNDELRKGKLIQVLSMFPEITMPEIATVPNDDGEIEPQNDPGETDFQEEIQDSDALAPNVVLQFPNNPSPKTPSPNKTTRESKTVQEKPSHAVKKKPAKIDRRKPSRIIKKKPLVQTEQKPTKLVKGKPVPPAKQQPKQVAKKKPPPPAKQQPKPVPTYEITIIVSKKADRVSIPGYGDLRLSKRNDGNKHASIRLKKGNYDLRIYQDGKLKCNKPFIADRIKTIEMPCR